MDECVFVSDLHGKIDRYQKLWDYLQKNQPSALFIGGDILLSTFLSSTGTVNDDESFIERFMIEPLLKLKKSMGDRYPDVFLILGNDDPAIYEEEVFIGVKKGVWKYAHYYCSTIGNYSVYGYSFIPPTPFQFKDWEKYDVSRHVDPGAVSPEEGFRSKDLAGRNPKYETIAKDLKEFVPDNDVSKAIFLFHAPPYQTNLDRVDLEGQMIDHVPLDVNVGSIAIKRFIEEKQPMLTLHGHIHESTRLTGSWREKIGNTHLFSAAHDGPELALVRFNVNDLDQAIRLLL